MTIYLIIIALALLATGYAVRPLVDDALDAWRRRRSYTLVRTKYGVTVCCPKARVLARARRAGRLRA